MILLNKYAQNVVYLHENVASIISRSKTQNLDLKKNEETASNYAN